MGASASSSSVGPAHHVAIGGLTGITHGTTRHVTWTLYNEHSGYHVIHLAHDGLSGARTIQCDNNIIFRQSFHANIINSSSMHIFDLATTKPLSVAEEKRYKNRRIGLIGAHPAKLAAIPPSERPAVCVRIDEEHMRFLYTLQIDHASYRQYQLNFWNRSTMYTWPMKQPRRRHRGSEDGVPDHLHSLIVVHSPQLALIHNGEVIVAECAFDGDGTAHHFTVESGVTAVLTATAYAAEAARGIVDLQRESSGPRFTYTLRVDGEVIPAVEQPPLMPKQWMPITIAETQYAGQSAAAPVVPAPAAETTATASEDKSEVVLLPSDDGLTSDRTVADAVASVSSKANFQSAAPTAEETARI